MWNPEEDMLVKNARSGEGVERIYDKLRERGVKEVSWPLFCNPHDSSVFRPLEDEHREVKPDNERAALLAYRAICYKTHIPRTEELVKLLLSLESPEKATENMMLFATKPLLDVRKRVESMVVARDYGPLKSKSILIPSTPSVACADAFIQIAEDEDKSIQNSNVTLNAEDAMTFTLFPKNENETLCVITWFEESQRGIEYVTFLNSLSQNEQYQFLMTTAFTLPNICISPVWWQSRSDEERQYLTGLQVTDTLATRNLQRR